MVEMNQVLRIFCHLRKRSNNRPLYLPNFPVIYFLKKKFHLSKNFKLKDDNLQEQENKAFEEFKNEGLDEFLENKPGLIYIDFVRKKNQNIENVNIHSFNAIKKKNKDNLNENYSMVDFSQRQRERGGEGEQNAGPSILQNRNMSRSLVGRDELRRERERLERGGEEDLGKILNLNFRKRGRKTSKTSGSR